MTNIAITFNRPALISTSFTILLGILCSNVATAAEFIPVFPVAGATNVEAYSISDDGSVLAGDSYGGNSAQAFRWTAQAGTVGLGFVSGDTASRAGRYGWQNLSGDGSIVAGWSHDSPLDGFNTFRYVEGLGLVSLDSDSSIVPAGISRDGSVITGVNHSTSPDQGWRWTEGTSVNPLGTSSTIEYSFPTDINSDGSIIVGLGDVGDGSSDSWEVFKWTEESGMAGTGVRISKSVRAGARFVQTTNDGRMLAGSTFVTSETRLEAFSWTEETGVVGLGWLPVDGAMENIDSNVGDMTPDGQLIVGWSGELSSRTHKAFVWTEAGGMEDFQQVLIDEHGLGDALTGWGLTSISAVSPNGQYFTGWTDKNPFGSDRVSWVVRLDAPWGTTPVPEPTTSAILLWAVALTVGPALLRLRFSSFE